MTQQTVTDMIVNRADLSQTEIVTSTLPGTLPDGQATLRIDSFALTANNITYAVAPDAMGYWNFFPVDHDGWGRVPVWGFAEVVASTHPQVAVGRRVYGYFPMSSHLVIEPGKITDYGMMDMAAHRQEMSPIYNQYSFVDADPTYAPDQEALIALLRPLFTTSFLLDDLHRENDCFGASRLLLSSASSKTAMGVAFGMMRDKPAGLEIVGLTSAGNMAFTQSLGCYDRVLAYEDLETLDVTPTAFVDMAGDADLLRRVHRHLDAALKNSCRVGLTHWQSTSNFVDGLTGGPKPAFFFAPSYAQERIAAWGRDGFQKRLAAASAAFFEGAKDWMQVTHGAGPEAVQAQYSEMLQGRIDPAKGHMLSLTA